MIIPYTIELLEDAVPRGAALAGRLRAIGRKPKPGIRAAEEDDIQKARRAAQAPLYATYQTIIEEIIADADARLLTLIRDMGVSGSDPLSAGLRLQLTPDTLIDVAEWVKETYSRTYGPVGDAHRAGFDMGSLRIGSSLEYTDDALARDIIETYMGRSTALPDALKERLTTIMEQAVRENVTVDELRARILQAAPEMAPHKATLYARLVGGGVHQAGEYRAWSDAGISRAQWMSLLAGENRRIEHLEMHEETAVMGEPFSNGLLYPRDAAGPISETAGCECYLVPVGA